MTEDRWWDAFRARLRKAREAAGKTQGDVADAVGMDRANVCHVERGRARVSAYRLVRLAEALGVEVEDLIPRGR